MVEEITLENYLKGIDSQIDVMKKQKQSYLDYRCNSGMSPMLEEFAKVIDTYISQFELSKILAKNLSAISVKEFNNRNLV